MFAGPDTSESLENPDLSAEPTGVVVYWLRRRGGTLARVPRRGSPYSEIAPYGENACFHWVMCESICSRGAGPAKSSRYQGRGLHVCCAEGSERRVPDPPGGTAARSGIPPARGHRGDAVPGKPAAVGATYPTRGPARRIRHRGGWRPHGNEISMPHSRNRHPGRVFEGEQSPIPGRSRRREERARV